MERHFTVQELITKLQEYDPNAVVCIYDGEDGYLEMKSIEENEITYTSCERDISKYSVAREEPYKYYDPNLPENNYNCKSFIHCKCIVIY